MFQHLTRHMPGVMLTTLAKYTAYCICKFILQITIGYAKFSFSLFIVIHISLFIVINLFLSLSTRC